MDNKERLRDMMDRIKKDKSSFREDMGKYPKKVFISEYTHKKLKDHDRHFQSQYGPGNLMNLQIVLDEGREPFEFDLS